MAVEPNAVAAYAAITDEVYPGTKPNPTNTLPADRSFSTAGASIEVTRTWPQMKVVFKNLALGVIGSDPGGVVHVRSASYAYNCNAYQPIASAGNVVVYVTCWQISSGATSFTPFTVNYTKGIVESGALATVRVNGSTPLNQQVTPVGQTNSGGGTTVVTHAATGYYTLDVTGLALSGVPAVTGTGAQNSRCIMLNLGTSVWSAIRFNVRCINASTGANMDAPFNFSYSVGTNLLGEKGQMSAAYAYIPPKSDLGPTVYQAPIQFNRIYGDTNGKITFAKQSVDLVRIDFERQGEGLGNPQFTITPIGSTAHCTPFNSPEVIASGGHFNLRLWVQCKVSFNEPPFALFVQEWVRQ